FSPDGRSIASGSQDNTAKIWDVPTTSSFLELANKDAMNAVAVSPDGKMLAGASKDGTVKTWTLPDGKPGLTIPGHEGPVNGVGFSADSKMIASAGTDQTVRFWTVADGKSAGVYRGGSPALAVLIHPNAQTAFSSSEDGTVRFWKLPAVP